MSMALGSPIPDLTLAATGGQTLRLAECRGAPLVLFFYPRASTPGCTQEARDFAAIADRFTALGARLLGASRDSLKAQENFKIKQELPFDLLSDPDEALCQAFDVMRMKKMYGKDVRGIERSTFLIDAEGLVRREWRKVQIKGHADEVLSAVAELAGPG
jgi:peroxiredoxin Q/BCP